MAGFDRSVTGGGHFFLKAQKAHYKNRVQQPAMPGSRLTVVACILLPSRGVLRSTFASPIARYTQAADMQLQNRAAYAKAVLGV